MMHGTYNINPLSVLASFYCTSFICSYMRSSFHAFPSFRCAYSLNLWFTVAYLRTQHWARSEASTAHFSPLTAYLRKWMEQLYSSSEEAINMYTRHLLMIRQATRFVERPCTVDSTMFIDIYLALVLSDCQAKIIPDFKLWFVIIFIWEVRQSVT